MKILYVDLEFDYGLEARGPNTIGQIGFKKTFENLGHEVKTFYYDKYLNNTSALQQKLLDVVEENKPDLVYFILFQDQFDVETLKKVKELTTTANWFGDDHWRFKSFTEKYAPCFTWNITTDPFALGLYKKAGIKNVHLSQWAALNLDLPAARDSYEFDVSFVGGYSPVRRWFLKELHKRGIEIAVYGHGWPSGSVNVERMMEIFQGSRINLNLGNSNSLDLRYLTDHIRNPLSAIRSQKNASQVKARNFEIPYAGGFQLSDFVPKLDLYFEIGKEIACFSNVDEAAQLIRYYLDNDDERTQIKRAGIKKAREEHTYFNRHKEFLAKLL